MIRICFIEINIIISKVQRPKPFMLCLLHKKVDIYVFCPSLPMNEDTHVYTYSVCKNVNV